jgi:hypothetical protein
MVTNTTATSPRAESFHYHIGDINQVLDVVEFQVSWHPEHFNDPTLSSSISGELCG